MMTIQTTFLQSTRDFSWSAFLILLTLWLSTSAYAQRPSIADLQSQIAALQAYVDPLQTYMDVDTTTDPTRPVVRVDGANLQIVSGAGSTNATPNGVGNLIVGYDEPVTGNADFHCSHGGYYDEVDCEDAGETWAQSHKSGSHNIVVGRQHSYSQYGGLVAGFNNTINGDQASVTGGQHGTASGGRASVSGGQHNTARGAASSVSGGQNNTTIHTASSISGGQLNTASGAASSVSGGYQRTALDTWDWVAGSLTEDF